MLKTLPILLIAMLPCIAYSQNYECIKPLDKQYFINNDYYLKGIRIDSMYVTGTDTVLIPFHTVRGRYLDSPGQKLDLKGGNWIGKRVIINPGGIYNFENGWGGTIVIKSQAQLNDKWTFYKHNNLEFEAQVTKIDTITIAGYLDSVKTITLRLNGDFLDGRTILLSKTHGFADVFDLYNFPFRKPGGGINSMKDSFDYYYDRTPNPMNNFRQMKYYPYKNTDITDYNVGDTIQVIIYGNIVYRTYSITKKNVLPSHTEYETDVLQLTKNNDVFTPAIYKDTLYVDTNYFISHMPEESTPANSAYNAIFYNENDTSYCFKGPLFTIRAGQICGDTFCYLTRASAGNNYANYKAGIGLTFIHYRYSGKGSDFYSSELKYYNIAGKSCRKYFNSIDDVDMGDNGPKVYPIPAGDKVNISFGGHGQQYSAIIQSMDGKVLARKDTSDGNIQFSVSNFPNGLYLISVQNKNGFAAHKKIIIQH